MKSVEFILAIVVLALATFIACASDPNPLQDFCVATDDPNNILYVNGRFCKNPRLVTTEDFVFSGLNVTTNTTNRLGTNITTVNAQTLPRLNTLGVSLTRIDYGPYGLNPPHTHPRATEILFVARGSLYAGFVSSNSDGNRFFGKVISEGDAIVFPMGMVHFQLNVGNTSALSFVAFGSQNPGTITVADAVFGSDPLIRPEVIARAFMLNESLVEILQTKFGA